MDTNTNLKVLNFDGKTLDQMHVTPDGKTLYDIIDEYITIGINLDQEQLNLTNQRLSIYVFDQILLKFMCINEKKNPHGIKGWYVPKGTQTVWTEIVKGQSVPDMGEIALFDCNSLAKCQFSSERASLKKKKRRKSKKKRFTKKKRKSKKKKSKRKFKRLTKKGKEWAKSMSNYMKQKKK